MQQGIWAIDIDRPYLVTYNLHNLQVGWLVVFLVLAQAGLNQSEQEENNQSINPAVYKPIQRFISIRTFRFSKYTLHIFGNKFTIIKRLFILSERISIHWWLHRFRFESARSYRTNRYAKNYKIMNFGHKALWVLQNLTFKKYVPQLEASWYQFLNRTSRPDGPLFHAFLRRLEGHSGLRVLNKILNCDVCIGRNCFIKNNTNKLIPTVFFCTAELFKVCAHWRVTRVNTFSLQWSHRTDQVGPTRPT